MTNLLLDDSGDLNMTGGRLGLVTGSLELAQRLSSKLKTFQGEWFLDSRVGIPYFSRILVKRPDISVLNSIFSAELRRDPGVKNVKSLNFQIDSVTRKLVVSFSVESTDGTIVTSNVVAGG